ncbi:MAG: T9SS type A sorting domain-containing protein [bacterium]|nr:T9SS type A sorting domain-containing protein [bacterium]
MKIFIKTFLIISGLLINNLLYALELHNLELVAELSAPDTNMSGVFGLAIASGDINGDGYSDIVVGGGLLGEDTSCCVAIYYGGLSLHKTPDLIIKEQIEDRYGWRFGENIEIGDINGDGFDDIIVMGGAHTRIYYGSTIMDTIADLSVESGSSCDASGRCGDLNGDGYDDWVIPDYTWNSGGGKVDIFFGGPTPDAIPDITLHCEEIGRGNFGGFVKGGYDVNDDGYDDLLISAVGYSGNGGTWAYQGKTYIYYGENLMDTIPDVEMLGKSAGDFFGAAIALTPDLNDDGYDDAFVGDPLDNVHDMVYGYWGGNPMNGGEDMIFSGEYYANRSRYGEAVAGLEKANLSGAKILVIGADSYPYPFGALLKGKVYIYLGGNSFDTTAEAYAIGSDSLQTIGMQVADAGDVNGDGCNEIMFSNYASPKTLKVWVCKYTGPGIEENSDSGRRSSSGGNADLKIIKDKIYLSVPNNECTNALLTIYDLCGRMKEIVYTGVLNKGNYTFTPNIRKSGIYFVRLTAGTFKETKKLILIK